MKPKKIALSLLKKSVVILFLGIIQWSVNAQETESPAQASTKKTSPISLGASGGIDYNFNTYYTNGNYPDKYVLAPTYNAGLDFGVRLSPSFRLRVEFKYNTMGFGAYYHASGEVTSTTPEKFVLWMYRLGFGLRLDYRFLTIGKLDVLFTPGLRFEYRLYDYEKTTYINGNEKSTSYLNEWDYTHTLSGGTAGLMFRYNLNDHWGITLSPEYTYFFKKLYSQNTANLQRLAINLGVEWRF